MSSNTPPPQAAEGPPAAGSTPPQQQGQRRPDNFGGALRTYEYSIHLQQPVLTFTPDVGGLKAKRDGPTKFREERKKIRVTKDVGLGRAWGVGGGPHAAAARGERGCMGLAGPGPVQQARHALAVLERAAVVGSCMARTYVAGFGVGHAACTSLLTRGKLAAAVTAAAAAAGAGAAGGRGRGAQ